MRPKTASRLDDRPKLTLFEAENEKALPLMTLAPAWNKIGATPTIEPELRRQNTLARLYKLPSVPASWKTSGLPENDDPVFRLNWLLTVVAYVASVTVFVSPPLPPANLMA